jgi:hypothetical protein
MKKVQLLIAVALLVHAVAWFLPVVKGEVTFPHGLPGGKRFAQRPVQATGPTIRVLPRWSLRPSPNCRPPGARPGVLKRGKWGPTEPKDAVADTEKRGS